MNIFQIPQIQEDTIKTTKLITLIDTSGSMEPNWPFLVKHFNAIIPKENALTLTFDTKTYLCESNILSEDILEHGGGGTNIYLVFKRLEEELEKIDKKENLTILFISDGEHNSGGEISELLKKLKGNVCKRNINFLCLGVGDEFPTFLAMELRLKYHTGDLSIPAIFMIEFVTEKAIEIKLKSLLHFLKFNERREIFPKVCLFPWREYTSDVCENSWVLSNEDKVKLGEDEMEISEFHLNIKGIQELFRSWSQMMQIDSAKEGEDIASRARKTLVQMDEILEELKEVKKIDLLKIADKTRDDSKLSFKERAWNNFLRHNYERTKWFYDDVKNLAESDNKNKLSAFEAAKKIGVGTIVGNYQMKIMNLKVVTLERFKKIKEDFKLIFKSSKIVPSLENTPFESIKKTLLQPDFLKGLDHCKSSYDISESLPLTGLPIRMVKTNPEAINAWDLDIKYISDTKEYIDSAMIYKNDGAWTITVKDKKETVNTIVPLLNKNDKDLLVLFKSELFKVVMTVNILGNGDFIANDGYEALLVQCLVKVLGKENLGDFEKNVVERILDSAEIYLEGDKAFGEFIGKVEKKIISSVYDDVKKQNLKTILIILLNNRRKKINVKEVEEYVNSYLYNELRKEFRNNILSVVKGQNLSGLEGENLLKSIEKEVLLNFKNFFTIGDFSRCLKKIYIEKIAENKVNITININDIKKKLDCVNLLKNISNYCGLEIDIDKKLNEMIFLVDQIRTKNFMKMSEDEKENLIKENKSKLRKEFFQNLIYKKNSRRNSNNPIYLTKEFKNLEKKLKTKFIHFFKTIHKMVFPISEEDLKKLKKTNKKIEINDIKLFRNVCMAKNCKFYAKNYQNKRLSHHMAIWGKKLPLGFHLKVSISFDKDSKIIFKELFGDKYDAEHYGYTENEVLEYISLLKNSYKKISDN